MGRILFECLDNNIPAGGVRRIYRHVEILRKHGFDAYVLHHEPGFRVTWFDSLAPIAYCEYDCLDASDVLVIPEGHVDVMRRTIKAPYRRFVIALNWSRVFLSMRKGESWKDFGISHVVAGSVYERDFIKRSMGMESTAILSGIDSDAFRPSSSKLAAIAYMPRKDVIAAHLIECIFRVRFPELSHIAFIAIDRESHSRVAQILSESAIFLAQTTHEGLSRKMLEAMSCGCIVVGFAGNGSLECMENGGNCFRVPDGDVLAAAESLGEAVHLFLSGGAAQIQANAVRTAGRYSLEHEEQAVVRFWSSVRRTEMLAE
jgi:hypothetical protein